jgi:hypothetical protein
MRAAFKAFRSSMAVFFCLLFSSCSAIQAVLYSSFVNEDNVEEIIANEKNVKIFLENVLDKSGKYTISVYERKLTRQQKKKTKLRHHRYYVIKAPPSDEYHTLSFYGTKIAFYSEGVWILNAHSDRSSYTDYYFGKNKWDVAVIETPDGIDTAETIKKIIAKIENRVRYYYKDHINDKPGVDNCNTAVKETLVRKRIADN